ncbi:hypothetical protein QSE00_11010 [Arenibacter sp. M-2]|uniref:hypothetical protein n=1 Tax=unclassified Arenibacter TaxID=2615047 RepID=UPI000D853984|nr:MULTISPECIES: hypothetical protein [unclassified Arenibacter]MDL5512347.1 hypothetical protein [Arenibacter sp. M-2]PXX26437.1 hypothetical protein C7972_109132 [Arenibacter sp. ARW7G5Y1]|tara:strand:- start:60803 stop:61018 length:216 start_codon:yes stop_codon:yes gene_type:complete
MTTLLKVEQLISEESKNVISRNLSRILDLRILDIDIINKTILLVYNSPLILDKVEKELGRVGYSLQNQHSL